MRPLEFILKHSIWPQKFDPWSTPYGIKLWRHGVLHSTKMELTFSCATGCILMKVQKYELPTMARMQPVSCYWYQIFTLPMTFDIMFPKIPLLNSKNVRMGRKVYLKHENT